MTRQGLKNVVLNFDQFNYCSLILTEKKTCFYIKNLWYKNYIYYQSFSSSGNELFEQNQNFSDSNKKSLEQDKVLQDRAI